MIRRCEQTRETTRPARKQFAVLAGVAVLLTRCTTCAPPADPGWLTIAVETSRAPEGDLAGMGSITLHLERVDVVLRTVQTDPSSERIVTLGAGDRLLRFKAMGLPGVPRIAGHFAVPPGYVAQLRFVVSRATAQQGGQRVDLQVDRDLTIPSGAETGVKVIPAAGSLPFPIVDGGHTYIKVTFDPNEQIVTNRGRGLLLKPVLRAAQVSRADTEATYRDRISVTFRPGVSRAQIDELNRSLGTTILGGYAPFNHFQIQLPPGMSVADGLRAYWRRRDLVQNAGVIMFLEPAAEPNDPFRGPVVPEEHGRRRPAPGCGH